MPDKDENRLSVGVFGCGSIGRELAYQISQPPHKFANINALCDRSIYKAQTLNEDLQLNSLIANDLERITEQHDVDVIVECASISAVWDKATMILESGKDLMIMSSGALSDEEFLNNVTSVASKNHQRLIVPSGAIGGIDTIKAVKDQLETVTLTTTKHPKSLKGAPGFKEWENKEITEPILLYSGSAKNVVALFPSNTNVGTTLSLAGIGPDKTKVNVIADPSVSVNKHEIEAHGKFGSIKLQFLLEPSKRNPKTSSLAILSAVEALRTAYSSQLELGT